MIDNYTYIYGLFDPRDPNKVRYIGKADDYSLRLRSHINHSKSGKHSYLVNKWIINLLSENVTPIVKPLLKIDRNIWENVEKLMIAYFRIFEPSLLNMASGGDGGYYSTGKKMSEEAKKRISKALKGRVFTKEHRERLSVAGKKRKYPPMSEETKKKISETNKGMVVTKETIRKRLLTRAMNGKINKLHSKETIEKIAEANWKPVYKLCPKTDKIIDKYNSIKEATKITGINGSTMVKCLKGNGYYKTAGGFKWKYV